MTSTSKLFRILDSHFWHDQILGILRFWHHQIFGTSQFLTWSDFWCSQHLTWSRFLDSQDLTWSDFGHFKFWDHGIIIMTPSWHHNFEITVELECWFASRPPPRPPVWRHRGWSRGTHTHTHRCIQRQKGHRRTFHSCGFCTAKHVFSCQNTQESICHKKEGIFLFFDANKWCAGNHRIPCATGDTSKF